MKKIMFALIVAACAVAVNGAQVKWQFKASSVADANSAGLGANPVVYMVLSSDLASSYSSASDIANDATGSGASFTIGTKSATATGTVASPSIAVGSQPEYYLVMVDGANNRYSVFGTYTSTAATADGATDVDPSTGVLIPASAPTMDTRTVTLSTATWKSFGGGSGGIPEPTSGLLLLVGGAMLALRRKQK